MARGYRYFAYSLARELGYLDVDKMLSEITWKQFREWVAFYRVEKALQDGANKPQPQVVKPASNKTVRGLNQQMARFFADRDKCAEREGS